MSSDNIISASYINNASAVRALVADGADINSIEDSTGFTPLHIATLHGYVEIFAFLIEQSSTDLWVQDRWGRTPGMIAIADGDGLGLASRIEAEAARRKGGAAHPAP